ncbi:MAG: GreA/GreB family elongation factor [Phycisphaerales bacterium]|jgi:regulator of nucleoside diphosphate kinase|nr:GreA/GreB family elongation factor [Phycisphaerales bacterium]
MTTQPIISTLDSERLEPLVSGSWTDAPVLRLRALLGRASKVAPPQVPSDVVTMNSRVRVRYPGENESEALELTFPDAGGLSVLSPLGAALFGAREGESVECTGARVSRRVTVERIEYQPERERHFDR